jgi:hypothetical protein
VHGRCGAPEVVPALSSRWSTASVSLIRTGSIPHAYPWLAGGRMGEG